MATGNLIFDKEVIEGTVIWTAIWNKCKNKIMVAEPIWIRSFLLLLQIKRDGLLGANNIGTTRLIFYQFHLKNILSCHFLTPRMKGIGMLNVLII